MAPYKGSIHRRPRSDSGAARLYEWARKRRSAWTSLEAAEACEMSNSRCRVVVRALRDAGLLDCVSEAELTNDGAQPALWTLSTEGRALTGAPILVVDRAAGMITGVRTVDGATANDTLRKLVQRLGLSGRDAAKKLGINDRTLRRMLSGETPISRDDPVIKRARDAIAG